MITCYTDNGDWLGDEKVAKFLCEEKGIAPEHRHEGLERGVLRPCSIGFCEKEQKWYGWSHRAVCGFGVGSAVKQGDCAYTPTDMEDARLDAIRFWTQDSHLNVTAISSVDEDGKSCLEVQWLNCNDPKLIPNEKIRGQLDGVRHYPPKKFGNGEWTAKTLDDARQMACDFAEGVS